MSWRKVIEIWLGAFPDVKRIFLSLSCFHCADPLCEAACPTGAISKRDSDGIVVVDRGICSGCRDCLSACPHGIPQFGLDGTMQKCDLCLDAGSDPACAAACPGQALFAGKMEDLAGMVAGKAAHIVSGGGGPSLLISNNLGPRIPAGRFTFDGMGPDDSPAKAPRSLPGSGHDKGS